MDVTNTLEIGTLLMGLLGGLALFLFGMDYMTDALKLVAGDGMKNILARLTSNRFSGVFAGAFITSIIQSSSVTTVLVVGFISAGLMTLAQSIGVILGADIGTTITAQIIAFKVTRYALALIALGFALNFLGRKSSVHQVGAMIMGLGLIFFGMELMSNATRPLRTYEPFINMMTQMSSPFWGILIGTVFTGLIQSSSATIGIVIVLASQGFISLEAGIALAFGANIGTCVTAILASIGKPREAVQAALVHVTFKVIGVLIWLAFIPQLAQLVRLISPAAEGLSGIARLGAETPRQIANAHTVFNVANTFLFVWFTGPIAQLMERIVPVKPDVVGFNGAGNVKSKHLNDIVLRVPILALDSVCLELFVLGDQVLNMLKDSLVVVLRGSEQELKELELMDDTVDLLQGAIVTYLGELSQRDLSKQQSYLLQNYMAAANYLENIGDTLETNLVEVGRDRLRNHAEVSPETQEVLGRLHQEVYSNVEKAIHALAEFDTALARQVIEAKPVIASLADEADRHLSRRLTANEADRLTLFRIETDTIEYLRRVYYFAKRIARLVVNTEGDGINLDETDASFKA
ncbi:MAG: Na/Pi cotransporter family protein [Deinococcota bacterium]